MKYVEPVARAFVFLAVWIGLAFALFRAAVPFLWGSASDFGMLAAFVVGVMGLAGLILLAGKMVDTFNRKEK